MYSTLPIREPICESTCTFCPWPRFSDYGPCCELSSSHVGLNALLCGHVRRLRNTQYCIISSIPPNCCCPAPPHSLFPLSSPDFFSSFSFSCILKPHSVAVLDYWAFQVHASLVLGLAKASAAHRPVHPPRNRCAEVRESTNSTGVHNSATKSIPTLLTPPSTVVYFVTLLSLSLWSSSRVGTFQAA
jgi:hypothetical protein